MQCPSQHELRQRVPTRLHKGVSWGAFPECQFTQNLDVWLIHAGEDLKLSTPSTAGSLSAESYVPGAWWAQACLPGGCEARV